VNEDEGSPVTTFRIEDNRGNTVFETDDWVTAQQAALTRNWPRGRELHVRGTHPTHQWGPPHPGQNPAHSRRCTKCNGWDNGSYGSQAPCGYDWSRDSLVSALECEIRQRQATL
jgi:hypothetical protein